MRLSNYAFLFFLILSCSQSSKELVYPKTQKIPGSEGLLDSLKEAESLAVEIGYPIMLKATAGGG
ncbi:hypothetical protein N8902_02285, partial [Flavobacteriaceae bacterium]|nr:hypothetical protein [Flavobacteriaceae bacterium]